MSLPDYPLAFFPLAVLAILLTGIAKGGFGAVAGGLAVPLMSIVIPPPVAAGIMLPILCTMDIFGVRAYWKRWSKEILLTMVPGSLIGITLGGLVFGMLSVNAIRLIVGLIAVLFALNKWLNLSSHIAKALAFHQRSPGKVFGAMCGLFSGLTSTLTHVGGPPFAVYIYSLNLDKTLIVATSSVFFCIGNYVKLIPYFFLGQLNLSNLSTSLVLLPLAPLGVWMGIWLHKRIPERAFLRVSYTLLFLSGLKLIYDVVI